MIRPEHIPDGAWKATGLPEIAARAVIASALNSWKVAKMMRCGDGYAYFAVRLEPEDK